MEVVGIRKLKSQLSAHLKRVQAGARLTVTDRGRPIATIAPADAAPSVAWAARLAAEGRAAWNGGRPRGLRPRTGPGGTAVSRAVIEDRR